MICVGDGTFLVQPWCIGTYNLNISLFSCANTGDYNLTDNGSQKPALLPHKLLTIRLMISPYYYGLFVGLFFKLILTSSGEKVRLHAPPKCTNAIRLHYSPCHPLQHT